MALVKRWQTWRGGSAWPELPELSALEGSHSPRETAVRGSEQPGSSSPALKA